MPEKFALHSKPEILEKRFGIQEFGDYKPNYNISPAMLTPVITSKKMDKLDFFYWGISPEWAKNKRVSKKLCELPKEDIISKSSVKRIIEKQRCLLPADGYFAWKRVNKKRKTPYYVHLNTKVPFLIAGIWELFDDQDKKPVHTFRMITVPSNELMKDFEEPMPAIIPVENAVKWLDDYTPMEEVLALLQTPKAADIGCYPISPLINTSFDGPEVINTSPPVDQFGNYTLFD